MSRSGDMQSVYRAAGAALEIWGLRPEGRATKFDQMGNDLLSPIPKALQLHGPMPRKPPKRLIRRIDLLDLLDRRPPAEPRQAADLLQVDEVAGGERVGFAAAEEAEALHRPGADLRNRQQPPVAAGVARLDAACGDLAGDRG